jgi:hypothetical protein
MAPLDIWERVVYCARDGLLASRLRLENQYLQDN